MFFRSLAHFALRLPLLALVLEHELSKDVHGHGEDDGGVVLSSNTVQSLQIPELKKGNKKWHSNSNGSNIILIAVAIVVRSSNSSSNNNSNNNNNNNSTVISSADSQQQQQ